MYKLLLCWRYLCTRYLALACIISVMLGVATLIVVNSVMTGFSTKLKDRLHGLLSDVIIEAVTFEGIHHPEQEMARIRTDPILKDRIKAMTPTLEVFAMLQFQHQGQTLMRPVHIIGIDPEGRASLGGFAEYLTSERNRARPSFELDEQAQRRHEQLHRPRIFFHNVPELDDQGRPPPDPPPSQPHVARGIIVGHALAHVRRVNPETGRAEDVRILHPGEDVILTTVSGERLVPVYDRFTVCDYFKSEMSEYDANYVFVPLDHLQQLRTMEDRVNNIQIRLKDYRDAKRVVERLNELFPPDVYAVQISTWEKKQGALLAAISIEKGLLNILLFLIIAVAGFGILAIFSMIVVEKTRDIGILKALGASNLGVMNVFLGYGLLLGIVGAGLGTLLGLEITWHINEIEKAISNATGAEIFDRSVYYFNEIPTDIQPLGVLLVNLGSVGIAVFFSIVPALRAAWLQPVRALRYE